jgi:hypothetical protein
MTGKPGLCQSLSRRVVGRAKIAAAAHEHLPECCSHEASSCVHFVFGCRVTQFLRFGNRIEISKGLKKALLYKSEGKECYENDRNDQEDRFITVFEAVVSTLAFAVGMKIT